MQQLHGVLIFSICVFIISRFILNQRRRKLSDFNEIISSINTAMVLCGIIAFLILADFVLLLLTGKFSLLLILFLLFNVSEIFDIIKKKERIERKDCVEERLKSDEEKSFEITEEDMNDISESVEKWLNYKN